MKSVVWALSATLLYVLPCAAAPLQVYGELPHMEDAQLSPDGERIALTLTKGDVRRIIVMQLSDMAVRAAIDAGDHKLRGTRWVDNDNIVFHLSGKTSIENQDREVSYGYIYTVSTRSQKPLVFNAPEAQNRIYSDLSVRKVGGKTQIFFRTQAIAHGSYDGDVLIMSEPTAKRSVVVNRGDFHQNDWFVDATGKVLAQATYDEYSMANSVRSKIVISGPQGRHTVRAPGKGIIFGISGLSADGQSLIVPYGDVQGGEGTLGHVSIATGEWLPETLPTDATHLELDPDTGRLSSYRQIKGDTTVYNFLDADQAKFWSSIERAFKGSLVTPISWTADRSKAVVLVDSPSEGPAYAMVDRATMRADWLGDAYKLEPADLSPVRSVSYQAGDGLQITGYLTLPYAVEPKGLPLVVLPHGGPAARDVPGFDWWSQALAARGYAVLRPNFRGSDGLGQAFLTAGVGEWGRKMQTDLSDGVRHLAASGVIDPTRVCIAGASYGGYAALAGATIDKGVYRCAASVAGPSDLPKMIIMTLEADGKYASRYWTSFMGVSGRSDPVLKQISPAHNAEKADIPVLLIHGKDDVVVPYEQSTLMADALRKAGKSVELVTLEGEDHYLSSSKTRLQMLTSLVAFLEKHNPPNPPATTASLP